MTISRLFAILILIGLPVLVGPRPGSASEFARPAQSAGRPAAGLPPDISSDSRARLPLPRREQLDAEGQRIFDLIVNPKTRYRDGLRGPVAMWMHSPPLAEHMFAASTYLRYRTQFDQRLTELAILVTARELDSQYVWTAHEPLALAAGLEAATIDIVKHRGRTAGLGKPEAVIVEFGRELVGTHALSSATFANALAMFGRQGVTNLAGLMAYYTFNSTIIHAFDVHLRPGQEPRLP